MRRCARAVRTGGCRLLRPKNNSPLTVLNRKGRDRAFDQRTSNRCLRPSWQIAELVHSYECLLLGERCCRGRNNEAYGCRNRRKAKGAHAAKLWGDARLRYVPGVILDLALDL